MDTVTITVKVDGAIMHTETVEASERAVGDALDALVTHFTGRPLEVAIFAVDDFLYPLSGAAAGDTLEVRTPAHGTVIFRIIEN